MRLLLLLLHVSIALPVSAETLRTEGVWPLFRGDHSNSGWSALKYKADPAARPWSFPTGKGIFSTAVVDKHDRIYVGSADSWFYALSGSGELRWRYKTAEVIDSAAALSTDGKEQFITIPSGDGYLHHLRLPPVGEPQLVWKFNAADHPHPSGKGYDWFEGNVVLGPDGHFYAGNTNWNFYAVDEEGRLRWKFPAGNMNWSAAAFDVKGDLYVASLDFRFRKLRAQDGKVLWEGKSLGFNAGSLVLLDHMIIGTSFDRGIYALDQTTGKQLWRFATQDHVYGSVAVSKTSGSPRIYAASTDGRLYALDRTGQLLWSFDSGDVIRSSPVVHEGPEGQDIIYFGGGDGLLYAINADGRLRWAYDTNSRDPYLQERNDLNASPALTHQGVVIGGEHGQIWFVPFDYPLMHPEDPRSRLNMPSASEGIHTHILTPGSRILHRDESFRLPIANVLTLRIQNIKNGQRQDGGLNSWFHRTRIRIEPEIPFTWQPSAKADTIFIKPEGFWQPDTSYRIHIDGQWMSRGLTIGALEIGASQFMDFEDQIEFSTASIEQAHFPWQGHTESIDSFEIHRLAINQPSMLPSLNQIGFDSYHWLVSLVEVGEGKILAWVLGARPTDQHQVEPASDREFRFPMTGTYQGEHFILRGENIHLNLGGIDVRLKELEFRGQFAGDKRVSPLASAYALPAVSSDAAYAPAIAALGLVNNRLQLPMSGSFLTRPYKGGKANQRPEHLQLKFLCYKPSSFWKDGHLEAIVDGKPMPNDLFDFLLFDRKNGQALYLPEQAVQTAMNPGRWRVTQKVPRGAAWPQDLSLRLMVNLFPLEAALCDGEH
jgi:outer membrane protein assembly factor BamB